MKGTFLRIAMTLSVLFCAVTVCFSDPLDTVPAWYFQLSGGTQGAMKIQFTNGTLNGTGATKGGGVMVVTGTYSFSKADTFTGTYSADSEFSFEAGTFQGKLSKKGDKVTITMLSDAGDRLTAKGAMSPVNTMIDGTFNISLSGRDRGSFTIKSEASGHPDIFHLSGSGETLHNGSTALDVEGYCDGTGNIYGSWSADGESTSVEGTFTGKFKNGKISARCASTDGDVFTIKN
jgi:hypothetical protein